LALLDNSCGQTDFEGEQEERMDTARLRGTVEVVNTWSRRKEQLTGHTDYAYSSAGASL
jgi:hypothetical protein